MVDKAFRRGIHFTKTPLDCKSKDLDYKLLEGDYKKAIMSQRSAQSTINKLAIVLKSLRNGGQDLQGGGFISPRHQWTINLMTWTTDYCRNTTKSGHKSKYQLTAQSINWPRAWKHSGMVDRTFRREIHFTQTPMDYKYDDLDYRLLQEHYQKRS
jgi:hypothetical protein